MIKNNKSQKMNELLEELTTSCYCVPYSSGQCPTCGSDKVQPTDFRDALSLKEYGISHMCQVCQDEVFSEPQEEE